ncbi:MAG: translocation/assembly module TamB domain-containing protein, partial [Lentimicrobiaceae bacterium]|nr:translocation/assembly module TamB domain-containing protein [Lentimicrobiaceae bacterium]
MNRQKIKSISKRIGKILLWVMSGIVGVILLLLILLCVPSVQTYLAKKAANFLSEQMQTKVSVDKLRIDFRLNVCFENLRLHDQHGNNLISAKKGRAGLSYFRRTEKGVNIQIRPIVLDSADVTLRRYAGDTSLNIQFFIDFVKPKEKNDKTAVVDLQQLQLINSRFQCRMDDTWEEDEAGVWNYRDIRLNDINLNINQLMIVGDSLTFQIDKLSTREHSGFKLDNLTGQLIIYRKGLYCLNTRFQTENKSDLLLDLRFNYNDFSDFGDFINIVSFNSEIHEGVFNLKDLGYFAGKLQGMETMVDVKTKVSGPIVDFKIKNTHLAFGQGTDFEGDISLTGLPNIEETFIDLAIKDLKTTVADLEAFQLPMQRKIPIPDMVQNLEWVKLHGHFIGLYDNFFSDMQLSTALGGGSCELMLNARATPVSYDGKLDVENLMLGNLLKYNDLGLISAKTQIKGKGLSVKDMDLGIDAAVSVVEFKNHPVENIVLTGNLLSKQFEGLVKCDDKDFDLDFLGNIDFNQEKPIYNFDLDVRAINLSSFQLFRPDSNVVVSAKIKADLLGNNIDSIQGSLMVENFIYTENDSNFSLPKINLRIDQLGGRNQQIKLNSDVLDIAMQGEFTYKQAASALQNRIHSQLSKLVPNPAFSDSNLLQMLDIELKMKQNIPLLVHFFPIVTAPEGLSVKLSMNEKNNALTLAIETPQLTVKDFLIENIQLTANQLVDDFNVEINCEGYHLNKTDLLADVQNFKMQSSIKDNVISFSANAKGNEKNKVESLKFQGLVGFEAKNELWVNLKRGIIDWNENTFVFDTLNYAHITPQHIYIENFGLRSRDRQKSINIKSASTDKDDNNLNFSFNQIDLGMFNMILNPFQISLEGSATGSGKLIRLSNGWGLGSGFQIEDLVFNDVPMGFLDANTVWQGLEKKLYLGANLYETPDKSNGLLLSTKGYFDPANKYIHIDGDINRFNIKILEPFLKSFASKIEGTGSGKITFAGQTSAPALTGEILLQNAALGIAFLKTEYKISEGKLRFVDTGFIFDNLPVRDAYKGKGWVNGTITHKRLRNWGVDLRIQAENMIGMNTTAKDNKLFYGKAFATGNITIKGKVDNLISIGIDATTNPLTDITLPLDWATTAVENNFVTFVSSNKETNTVSVADSTEIAKTKLAVNLKIKATPDAVVKVLLDPSIGGSIIGRGNSILEINLDENEKFSIFGKYTLMSGDFNLAYADVLTRTFKLENGSSLAWNGNPMEGIIDIKAVQTAKISNP